MPLTTAYCPLAGVVIEVLLCVGDRGCALKTGRVPRINRWWVLSAAGRRVPGRGTYRVVRVRRPALAALRPGRLVLRHAAARDQRRHQRPDRRAAARVRLGPGGGHGRRHVLADVDLPVPRGRLLRAPGQALRPGRRGHRRRGRGPRRRAHRRTVAPRPAPPARPAGPPRRPASPARLAGQPPASSASCSWLALATRGTIPSSST